LRWDAADCIIKTVQRCVERAVAEGPIAALDDRPRPGREPTITLEAKAWLVWLACRKAKDFGYPHELWTTRLLAGAAVTAEDYPVGAVVCVQAKDMKQAWCLATSLGDENARALLRKYSL
jgi:Homeodomain-like domain